jgi:hypothetical protein
MIQSKQIKNNFKIDPTVNTSNESGYEIVTSSDPVVVIRSPASSSPVRNHRSADNSSSGSAKSQQNLVSAFSNAANATSKSFNSLINKMNEKGKRLKKSDSVGSMKLLEIPQLELTQQQQQQSSLKSSSSSQILSSTELKYEDFEIMEMEALSPALPAKEAVIEEKSE